jgi:hypothetical protein
MNRADMKGPQKVILPRPAEKTKGMLLTVGRRLTRESAERTVIAERYISCHSFRSSELSQFI